MKRSTKRAYRFELLEKRQMLSADGLGFELSRERLFEMIASDFYAEDVGHGHSGRDHHHDRAGGRSHRGEGRGDSDRGVRDRFTDTSPLTPALSSQSQPEGEFVDVQVDVDPPASERVAFTVVVIRDPVEIAPVAASAITNTIESSRPPVAPRISLQDLLGSQTRSAGSAELELRGEVEAVEVSANSSTDLLMRDLSRTIETNESTDSIDSVSRFSSDQSRIHLASFERQETFSEIQQGSTELWNQDRIAVEVPTTPLDSWLQENSEVSEQIGQLDRIINSISAAHSHNSSSKDVSQRTPEFELAPEPSSAGMILLSPVDSASVQPLATVVLDRIEETQLDDWSVGIGFFQTLQVVGGDNEPLFDNEQVRSDSATDPLTLKEIDWEPEPISPASRATGVLVCLVGFQYLYRRNRLDEQQEDRTGRVPMQRS